MPNLRTTRTITLLAHLASRAAPLAPLALASLAAASATSLLGCADENDPKTWVKRLDDPAQRAPAIKRLGEFFDRTMETTHKNREAPEMKALLDDIVPGLTKTYVSVTLDEKTRKDLMRVLADTRDPRTAPALAKAFNEFEPGSTDDDVKFASQSVLGQATAGTLTDQGLIDALWTCFSKFHASKAKSINLVTDLHDAVRAVKSPSYGPKAVTMLAAPVDPTVPEQSRDQIQYWQHTAIQIIGDLKFAPGARALVTVILTPTKADLRASANAALLQMPVAAEPLLIAALKGTDPDFAKLMKLFDENSGIAVVADSLSWLSRPAGKAAVLEALAAADTDQNRTVLAQALGHYPADAQVGKAFLDAYNKIPDNTSIKLLGGANAHGVLTQVAAQFYSPSLVDWLVKEIATSKGEEADAMQLYALDSAIKLMQPGQASKVNDAINKPNVGTQLEKEKFKLASAVMDKCKEDAKCYAGVVAEPIPSSPATAAETAVKAAWMAVEYGAGKADVRGILVDKLPTVTNGGARLAAAEAIDALAPQGDVNAAMALEKIIAADTAKNDKAAMQADDALVKIAARLRARALP